MSMLLVATFTTLLCFLACTACMRFVLSRQGWFWILPLIISAIFLAISIEPLMAILSGMVQGTYQVVISPDRSVREIVPLIIVLLWYTMIIAFRYALKAVVKENKHAINTRKNLHESRIMEKVELKALKRRSAHQLKAALRKAEDERGSMYPPEWAAAFDE